MIQENELVKLTNPSMQYPPSPLPLLPPPSPHLIAYHNLAKQHKAATSKRQ